MIPDENLQDHPRQYGEQIHIDQGLAQLAQTQSDEEALIIEASLLTETDQIIDPAEQIEDHEEPSL